MKLHTLAAGVATLALGLGSLAACGNDDSAGGGSDTVTLWLAGKTDTPTAATDWLTKEFASKYDGKTLKIQRIDCGELLTRLEREGLVDVFRLDADLVGRYEAFARSFTNILADDLRTQIDELAKDSGFNGVNLLAGDQVSLVFNEKTGSNQSKMTIQGSALTADNLGISQAGNTQLATQFNFQNDLDLEKATEALTGALTSLKSLSSTFGSQLSVAQTRQDFTKEMANTLTIGADNLVLADSNEEGAKLLALNTRQQLSQTALSLASQADQSVLRLFG